MSKKKLNAVVVAQLVDKMTSPARKITDGMRKLRKTMKLKGVDERWRLLSRRLHRLKSSSKGLAKLSSVMVGVAGAATFMFSKLAGGNDKVAKFARQINWTTDQLQEMRYTAQILAGVNNNAFDTSMQRFTRRVAEAAAGTGEAQGALAYLGVELTDSHGKIKNTSVLLEEVADAIQKVDNEQTRNLISTKLFDTEGAALVNMLSAGREEIKKYRKEAREVGAVVDEDTLKRSEQFGDNMMRITSVMAGLVKRIQGALLPAAVELTDKFVDMVTAPDFQGKLSQGISDFVSALKEIKSVVVGVVDWFGGWKNATIALFTILGSAVIFNTIASIISLTKAIFSLGTLALPLVIAGFKWLAVAVALNPIGAMVAGIMAGVGLITAAAAAIITYWEPIKAFFSNLWQGAKAGFNSFIDLIGNGLNSFASFISDFFKSQFEFITGLIPDFVKDAFSTTASVKVERDVVDNVVPARSNAQVETLTTRQEKRAANKSGAKKDKTEVGGDLHITIDSHGMPRVKSLKQKGDSMSLSVDTGLAFSGT